jgi:pre-rRNA-processing protein TSR4
MAPYDSDSSGGEDNDYTETNVLLGYASKEASDDTISHLGGRPVCYGSSTR